VTFAEHLTVADAVALVAIVALAVAAFWPGRR
jgi:hypothetical protein